MADNLKAKSLVPPDDPVLHIAALEKAFLAGDAIALFQAIAYSQQQEVPLPLGATLSIEQTLVDVLHQKRGVQGKGNSAFGHLRKAYIRSVRASAYFYVRAWQKDPHRYHDLPVQTFKNWEEDPLLWQANRKAIDAARLAGTSLHGTEFTANASTVRRAAYRFPEPIRWGRVEAETKLGLRGSSGVFGPKPNRLKPHIEMLLSNRAPKS